MTSSNLDAEKQCDKDNLEEKLFDQEAIANDVENSEDGLNDAEEWPISIKVLSWNINGNNSAGFGRLRKTIVSQVVLKTKPDVILLQEIYPEDTPGSIKKASKNYEVAGRKTYESQVLYDSSKYAQISEEEKLFPIDSDVDKESLSVILDRAKDEVFLATNNKLLREGAFDELKKVFNERISIVGLRIKHYYEGPVMIFMSFHNVHKSIGIDIRTRAIEGFCQLVTKLHELTGCVVLAGADLNQQLVHPYPYPNILDYKPTPRRLHSGQIDYFILEPPSCLKEPVEPWNFIESLRSGDLNWLTKINVFAKSRKVPVNTNTRKRTFITESGIRKTEPYFRRATIEVYEKLSPHDPLLCTFNVPGYVLVNGY